MFVIDGHEDIATTLGRTGRDFGRSETRFSLSLPGLEAGGVRLVLATIFAPAGAGKKVPPAPEQLSLYRELASRFPDRVVLVGPDEAIRAPAESDPVRLVLLIEGADHLAGPEDLDAWIEAGVRAIGLTWNNDNHFAGGVSGEGRLTARGRDLLEAMEERGLLLDLSHLNDASMDDCLEAYGGRVVASHSNARAVAPHPRNLEDRWIEEIGRRNGVIGLNFYRRFLVPESQGDRHAVFEDLLRHAERMLEKAGPGVLALGTDFDGGFGPDDAVEGFGRAEDLANLGDAFAKRGFAGEAVRGLTGENWLRVLGGEKPKPK